MSVFEYNNYKILNNLALFTGLLYTITESKVNI